LRDAARRAALHAYLGSVSKNLDCPLRRHEIEWDERYVWD
jgi:hypothetical protein